ncbi:MAG: hypothetical protein AAF518_13055, partial [Spirochaetota bacterium]
KKKEFKRKVLSFRPWTPLSYLFMLITFLIEKITFFHPFSVSYQKAKKIAETHLKNNFEEDLVLDLMTDTWYGWIFHSESEKYMQTGEKQYAPSSNIPFVVLKRNGKIVPIGTTKFSTLEEEQILSKLERKLFLIQVSFSLLNYTILGFSIYFSLKQIV